MLRRLLSYAMLGVLALVVVPVGTSPATAAAVTTTPTATAPVAVQRGFIDVAPGMQFEREMMWLANAGISRGWDTAAGAEYRPLTAINRDAMAAFLYRLAAPEDYVAPATSPFVDVNSGNTPFYTEICWLADAGISTGWTTPRGREFRPVDSIARDAMAAFLYRLAELDSDGPVEAVPLESSFTDVPAGSQFLAEIEWLAAQQISTGWRAASGAQFRPLAAINRDAMAAFLYRYQAFVDPEIPAEDGVVVAPELSILDDAALAGAVFDSDTLTLPAGALLDVAPNDVLVSESTPATPHGMLVRVTAVSGEPDGPRILSVEQAALTDAIVTTSGLTTVDGTPIDSRTTAVGPYVELRDPSAPVALARPGVSTAVDVPVASFGFAWNQVIGRESDPESGSPVGGSGEISIGISTEYDVSTQVSLDIDLWGINRVDMGLTVDRTTTTGLEGNVTLGLKKTETLVKRSDNWKFFVGPVPVMIESEFSIDGALELSGTLAFVHTSEESTSTTVGFSYADGVFTPVNLKSADQTPADTTLAGSATVRASLTAGVDVRLYGIVGVQVSGGPYAQWKFAADFLADPIEWQCPIEIGLEGRIALVAGIKIYGFEVGPQFELGFDRSAVLIPEVDPCDGGLPTPPVPRIVTAELPSADEWRPYETQVSAFGGVLPHAWTVAGLPEGLEMDSEGHISGTARTPGTYPLTLTVQGALGEPVDTTVDLVVAPAPPLAVAGPGLPAALRDQGYAFALAGAGGVDPYTWNIGLDVPGLSATTDGVITGTPTAAGTFPVTVELADIRGESTTREMALTVDYLNARLDAIDLASVSGGAAGATPTRTGAISGDGQVAVMMSDFGLYAHRLDSGTVTPIAPDFTFHTWAGDRIAVDQDGGGIAFAAAGGSVAGDANPGVDAFWHDTATGTTVLASSLTEAGLAAPGATWEVLDVDISGDGRYVVFDAYVSGSADRAAYRFDSVTGSVALVDAGVPAGVSLGAPTVSHDGSLVAVLAYNSAPGATTDYAASRVLVTDMGAGTTVTASTGADGAVLDGDASDPHLASDGGHVAFLYDGEGARVMVKDLATGAVETAATAGPLGVALVPAHVVGISADGARVAFVSAPGELDGTVATDGRYYAWFHDAGGIQAIPASHDADREPVAVGATPSMSDDGRELLIATGEPLTALDANDVTDLYRRGLPY